MSNISEKKVFAILYKFKEEMMVEFHNIKNNQQYLNQKIIELENKIKTLESQSDYQLRDYPTKNFMKYFVEETEKQVKDIKQNHKDLESRVEELENDENNENDENDRVNGLEEIFKKTFAKPCAKASTELHKPEQIDKTSLNK